MFKVSFLFLLKISTHEDKTKWFFFMKKETKNYLNHRLFLSLLPRKKKSESRINNNVCFRFCVETAYECVCRRTKRGRFLSNLFLNLWSVCVFGFLFCGWYFFFFVFFGLVKKFCSLYISRFCALTLDDSFSFFVCCLFWWLYRFARFLVFC